MSTRFGCETKRLEQLVLGRREPHLAVADADVAPLDVDLEVARPEDRASALRHTGPVTKSNPRPSKQLGNAEGLGQVVVGSQVERGDLVALGPSDREHDDRHRHAHRPQLPNHLEPVEVGQAEIEYHEVRRPDGDLSECLAPAFDGLNLVPREREVHLDSAPDRRLVVDDEDSGAA